MTDPSYITLLHPMYCPGDVAEELMRLRNVLQKIASSDDMYEPASWAIHAAREALKPKP
jgi:hypothetical protein